MKKKLQSLFLISGLFFCFNSSAQLTELVLEPANVTGGKSHYGDGGRQSIPGASVNDLFTYNPNAPMSAYPEQGWSTDVANPTYYFMQSESRIDPDKTEFTSHTDFAFPILGTDNNFLSITFDIPDGKVIRYLDCWGQDETDKYDRCQNLVIKLKNATHQWFYEDWDGIATYGSADKGFGRFDFKGVGIDVTDNLLEMATQLVLTKVDRVDVDMRIAEFRIALEDKVTTDIEDEVMSSVRVFPNPSSDGFNVDLSGIFTTSEITVIDLCGRVVFKEVAETNSVHKLDLELVKGIYLLEVCNEGQKKTQKIVVK